VTDSKGDPPPNRSLAAIAAAGVVLQVALGAVYAWSVFRIPLSKQFGWSISEVTLTFTICIFVLGISSFFGGLWLNRKGPRIVALTGGFLYGAGLFLASFSDHGLWWLYLSYGLIGGIGLGFCYIVPIAVLVKWFPNRRRKFEGKLALILLDLFPLPSRRGHVLALIVHQKRTKFALADSKIFSAIYAALISTRMVSFAG
jgi:MFS family permease